MDLGTRVSTQGTRQFCCFSATEIAAAIVVIVHVEHKPSGRSQTQRRDLGQGRKVKCAFAENSTEVARRLRGAVGRVLGGIDPKESV